MAYHYSSASVPSDGGSGRADYDRICRLIPAGNRNEYLMGHELRELSQRHPSLLQLEAWEHAFLLIRIS
jgi:hypothetical protein